MPLCVGDMAQAAQADNQKQRELVSLELFKANYASAAIDFKNCGHPELIRKWRVCSANPHHYARPVGFSCHLRICPDCAKRESARLLKRYLPIARAAYEDNSKGYRLRHIVLTTGWSLYDADINARIRQAWKAFAELLCALWGERWQKSGRGWIGGFEFGEDGRKLHLHLLMYCEYIEQDRLSKEWSKLTGFPVVWINAVRGVKKGVKEVLKYSTKLTGLSPQDTVLLHGVLKGVRRVRAGGIFYNAPEPPKAENHLCKVCKSCISDMQCEEFNKLLKENAISVPRASALLHLIHGNKSANPPPVKKKVQFGVLIRDQKLHAKIALLTGQVNK